MVIATSRVADEMTPLSTAPARTCVSARCK